MKISYNKNSLPLLWIRFINFFFKQNYVAIVNPFNMTLYSLEEVKENSKLYKHEAKHFEQIQTYGKYKFILLYLKELICHGYQNNKFEVEARAAEK